VPDNCKKIVCDPAPKVFGDEGVVGNAAFPERANCVKLLDEALYPLSKNAITIPTLLGAPVIGNKTPDVENCKYS